MTSVGKIAGEVCRDFARSSKLEWVAANGTGGFAMGTVAGVNTRRYHGLLVASLKPPVERKVLLSRVEEEASLEINGGAPRPIFALGVCQYPGVVTPRGFEYLEEFATDPCPTWTFRLGANGPVLLKQVYVIEGRQAVVIRYRCDRQATLRIRPFEANRDYHSMGKSRPDPYGDLPKIEWSHAGRFEPDAKWYYNVEYLVELDRGFDFREDLFSPGTITVDLAPGEWSAIVAEVAAAGHAGQTPETPDPKAADGPGESIFVVRRADGRPTIIAGYPWFTDWGRDTMISLPGLLIAPGRLGEAQAMIEGFLDYLSQGMIPNRFPDQGEAPEYNAADSTLWMFQAVHTWLAAAESDARFGPARARAFLRDRFYPAAKEIIDWHRRGTRCGIGVDSADHLLKAGTPRTQLTWMDAKVGDWVVTPRHGKPVEINALWYGALYLAGDWGRELGDSSAAADFRADARMVRGAFRAKFWNRDRNCLFDVLSGDGPVDSLRPNQIFAVSLPHPLLEPSEQQAVVRIVERELLTPVGLRTLERGDPQYHARYEGSPRERDAAYHQGTVWPWLLGPYIDAYLTAFGKTADTLIHCRQLVEQLEEQASREGCFDSIAEVYDGEQPRRPGGCPAQAWSVAEMARVRAQHGWLDSGSRAGSTTFPERS